MSTNQETKPKTSKRKDSIAEILMMKHLTEIGIGYEREYRFHPLRLWRLDFLLRIQKEKCMQHVYGIEIEGGSWIAGRHTRGKGFEADIRKYNEATRMGIQILRFTPNMIERGESKAFLAELFGRQP